MAKATPSAGRDPDAGDVKPQATVEAQLSDVIEAMEAVEWRDVPTVSTAEAATFTQRLDESREVVREQADRPVSATGGDSTDA